MDAGVPLIETSEQNHQIPIAEKFFFRYHREKKEDEAIKMEGFCTAKHPGSMSRSVIVRQIRKLPFGQIREQIFGKEPITAFKMIMRPRFCCQRRNNIFRLQYVQILTAALGLTNAA